MYRAFYEVPIFVFLLNEKVICYTLKAIRDVKELFKKFSCPYSSVVRIIIGE